MNHTPGPWIMKPGDPDVHEGWSIEAPNSSHPLGPQYSRKDNVVGKCCSAGVLREEDARLICAAPMMLEALKEAVAALHDQDKRMELGLDSWIYDAKAAIEKAETGEAV